MAVLTAADLKNCIVNLVREEHNRECWIMVNKKKYTYRSWIVPLEEKWIQAIYRKKGNKYEILSERQMKTLYDEIETIGELIEEDETI